MSEFINNKRARMDALKSLLLKLNNNEDIIHVKAQIAAELKNVPYEDVLAVEQELIAEGMSNEKMLELCDLHSNALSGLMPGITKLLPDGHPVMVFRKENVAIRREAEQIQAVIDAVKGMNDTDDAAEIMAKMHGHLNLLMDIEKHYSRKENLLFPYLEKYQITGPSVVMWGKDDQVRARLKECQQTIMPLRSMKVATCKPILAASFEPLVKQVMEMIQKEEEILFPMSLDTLTEIDWHEIYRQTPEIGYCIIDEKSEWKPELSGGTEEVRKNDADKWFLPSGNFRLNELIALFNTLPVDLTFVDANDNVRFFSESPERIFQRSRAIIGRKVQYCHPPHSVHIVEQILSDFKSGKQTQAAFWINFHGQFIHIAYYALKAEDGSYLGTLEVSQNLTKLRALEGERRILEYDSQEAEEPAEAPQESKPEMVYDAREDLASGVHPAAKVLGDLEQLSENGTYLLITPFPPNPLIMKAQDAGFEAETKQISQTEFHNIFRRKK